MDIIIPLALAIVAGLKLEGLYPSQEPYAMVRLGGRIFTCWILITGLGLWLGLIKT